MPLMVIDICCEATTHHGSMTPSDSTSFTLDDSDLLTPMNKANSMQLSVEI